MVKILLLSSSLKDVAKNIKQYVFVTCTNFQAKQGASRDILSKTKENLITTIIQKNTRIDFPSQELLLTKWEETINKDVYNQHTTHFSEQQSRGASCPEFCIPMLVYVSDVKFLFLFPFLLCEIFVCICEAGMESTPENKHKPPPIFTGYSHSGWWWWWLLWWGRVRAGINLFCRDQMIHRKRRAFA